MPQSLPIPLEKLHIEVPIGYILFNILLDDAFFDKEKISKDISKHKHPAFELHYITGGETVCNVSGKEIRLRKGDFILLAPGSFHSFRESRECTRGYFQFKYTFRQGDKEKNEDVEISELLIRLKSLPDYTVVRMPNIYVHIEQAHWELKQYQFGCYVKIQSLFMRIVIDLLRGAYSGDDDRISTSAERLKRIPLKTKDENRTRIIDLFFERMIHEPLEIGQLAEELHLSVRQTQRVIQQLYGKSFKQIAVETHIEVAKELLATTTLTIREIADRLGYVESRHFSRQFISITGFTPTEYRSRIRGTRVFLEERDPI